MTAGHVCDECKNVAPLDEAFGWWRLSALHGNGGALLRGYEKPEYDFCSWRCLSIFATRMRMRAGQDNA